MTNKKEEAAYGILFCFLAGLSLFFFFGAETETGHAALLHEENEKAAAYHPKEDRAALFLHGKEALREAVEQLGESGARIGEITEETPEILSHGTVYRMKIRGTADFFQVLSLFDIIHTKKYWIAAELLSLRREGGTLRFELELAVYQGKETGEARKENAS